MDARPNSEFEIHAKTRKISKQRPQSNITIDNNTFASNPANVSVNPFVWISYHPAKSLFFTIGFIYFFIIAVFEKSESSVFTTFVFSVCCIYYWSRVYEHFRSGDANPGIVISTRPLLIAVSSDLTKGAGDFPVVKVIRKRLRKFKGNRIGIGYRLPTVALYEEKGRKNPFWSDFNPIPIQCGTNNENAVNAVMDSFQEDDWEELERRILQLPKPYKRGLYRIDIETSSWSRFS